MDRHSPSILKRKFPPEDHAPPFSAAPHLGSSDTAARNTVKAEPSDLVKEGNVNTNNSSSSNAAAAMETNGSSVTDIVVKEETVKSIFADILQTNGSYNASEASLQREMDTRRFVTVKYGGNWINSDYIGGVEQTANIYMPPEHVSVVNLRNNINNILRLNSFSTEYDMYCLSRSRSGRTRQCLLSTDQQVVQLFLKETAPVVHVVHSTTDVEVGTLGGDCQGPSSDPNGHDSHSQYKEFDANLKENLKQIHSVASSEELMVPNSASTNQKPTVDVEEDDDHDEDDLESESDASEDPSEDHLKRSALAEFAAWTYKEDGTTDRLLDSVHPSHHQRDSWKAPLNQNELTNWLVPMIPLDASTSLVARENDPTNGGELAEGSYYNSKDDLTIAMGMWHMEQGAEYAVDRSNLSRLLWKCKTSKKCPFELRAARHGNIWAVHNLIPLHTCVRDLGHIAPRKVPVKVVAALIARKMRKNSKIINPKAIMEELLRDFGIRIKKDLVLRAQNTALEMIYGGYAQSFQMLPGYLHMLEMQNPGTMTDLNVGDDGKFQYLFVALAASRLAYPLFLRPVIVVDGTHLKGKNRGILFVAVTKDANEQVYPLAYGVGPIDDDASWTWFLTRVRRAYGCKSNTLIVSDAHTPIANAVHEVYPDATHGLCHFQLLNEINHWGKFIAGLYEKAAYAYRTADFKRFMATINADKPAAYEKLMHVGPEKWARSMCPVSRYSFLTSSAAEIFNAGLLWARCLPICSLIEAIRHIIENWFDERREAANKSEDQLSEEAARKLKVTEEMMKERTYRAVHISGKSFKVNDGIRSCTVDLGSHSCDCREYDLDGIPCAHAIASIHKSGEAILEYVDAYYTRASLIEAYKHQIYYVPHRDDWVIPEDVANRIVLPPTVVRLTSRPRKKRLQSAGEKSPQIVPANKEEAPSSSRRRAPKKCSLCRTPGHIRKYCPDRKVED